MSRVKECGVLSRQNNYSRKGFPKMELSALSTKYKTNHIFIADK